MTLRVAPLEAVDQALLASVAESLRHGYGVGVELVAGFGAPDFAWDGARRQYNAPLILRRLLDAVAPGSDRLLAVTGLDLYIPMLSFVYGQAQLGGNVAVVSMARLDPAYHGLPPDEDLLHVRARKEALHEVGHLFGLVHCRDSSCAMALSTGIGQLDRKQPALCADCALLAAEGRGAAGQQMGYR
jgi:archaemetzincin